MSTHNIPFSIRIRKNTLNYTKSAAMGYFSKGLKNEFETAVVNEVSVFEPLKFYCSYRKPKTGIQRQLISQTDILSVQHGFKWLDTISGEQRYTNRKATLPLHFPPFLFLLWGGTQLIQLKPGVRPDHLYSLWQ